MKIVCIYGTQRKGSTYHIAKQFIEKLGDDKNDVREFFLPKDSPNFCCGCFQCITTDNKKCPHYENIGAIEKAMEEADLLIFTSPVYVYHATGQMKAFLDHFAYQWMVHRPNKTMFKKQALIISTAAGGGTKSTIKDISDSMLFWGVGKVYKYGVNVAAIDWNGVKDEKKVQIENDVKNIATKIKKNNKKARTRIKVKGLFYIMRFMQKKFKFCEVDVAYWEQNGWLGRVRPWK